MKIGISNDYLIEAVYTVSHAQRKNAVCSFFVESSVDGLLIQKELCVDYESVNRAAEALEKLLKKNYLVIPKEYIKKA